MKSVDNFEATTTIKGTMYIGERNANRAVIYKHQAHYRYVDVKMIC